MHWFYLAILSPLLYSVTNHIDKQLLSRYFREGGPGTLILISSLFSLLVLPVIPFFEPRVLDVGIRNAGVLTIAGILNVGIIWFYLLAMRDEYAAVVIVFYQLVPVIGLGIGYVFLGETISMQQFLAMVLIVAGASVLSFEMDGADKWRFKKKTVGYMLLACICWSLQSVLFKVAALEEDVWRSLFWQHVAMLGVGVATFACVRTYRQHFLLALRSNSKAILSLNAMNEVIYIIGGGIAAFAYMLAPVALILLVNSFQPLFVLVINFLLVKFARRLVVEQFDGRLVKAVVPAVALTAAGTYLLFA